MANKSEPEKMPEAVNSQSHAEQQSTLKEAIRSANLLVSYAAEQGKDVDPGKIGTIVRSGHASNSLPPLPEQQEIEFWDAYRHVCAATSPVSRESLHATEPVATARRFFGIKMESEATRAVRRYQWVTIICLIVLLSFQIYWVTLSTLVNDITTLEAKVVEVQTALDKSVFEKRSFIATLKDGAEKELASLEVKTLNRDALDKITAIDDKIIANSDLLKKINIFSLFLDEAQKEGSVVFDKSIAAIVLKTGSVSLEVMSLYVLPILYGLLGACAYILRSISHQISDRTFTTASTIRLQLRLVLGALTGFSIAWFSTDTGGVSLLQSITPLALAFIAGYSVEIVFSAMDAMIGAFSRQSKPVT